MAFPHSPMSLQDPKGSTSYGASNDGHSLQPLERSLPGDLGSKQRKLLCHCPL